MVNQQMEIKNVDLSLTKKGFIRIFEELKSNGLTIRDSFNKTVELCELKGYNCPYSSFESFKVIIYRKK